MTHNLTKVTTGRRTVIEPERSDFEILARVLNLFPRVSSGEPHLTNIAKMERSRLNIGGQIFGLIIIKVMF